MQTSRCIMDILLITLSVLVVSLNVSVCCMVLFLKRLRTFTNYFVASLAVSDILIGGVLLPLNFSGIPGYPVSGYIISIVLVSGVANLCAVTWDRYLAILSPLCYTERLRNSYKPVLVITWVFAILYSLLPLAWDANVDSIYHKCYLAFSMSVCVIAPYVFIVLAYIRIFQRLRKHMSQLKMFNISKQTRDGARRASIEGKTINVFLLVVSIFILSWAPIIYMTITEYIASRPDLIPHQLPFASLIIVAFASMINPFLYAFMKRDFNRELLKMFTGKTSIPDSPSRTSSSRSLFKGYFTSPGRRPSYRSTRTRRGTTSADCVKKSSTVTLPVLKRIYSEPRFVTSFTDELTINESPNERECLCPHNGTPVLTRVCDTRTELEPNGDIQVSDDLHTSDLDLDKNKNTVNTRQRYKVVTTKVEISPTNDRFIERISASND